MALTNPVTGYGLGDPLLTEIGMAGASAATFIVFPGALHNGDKDSWKAYTMIITAAVLTCARGSHPNDPIAFPFASSAFALVFSILGKYLWWTLTGNGNVEVVGFGLALHGDDEKMSEVVGDLVEQYGVNQYFFIFIVYFIYCSVGRSFGNLGRACARLFGF